VERIALLRCTETIFGRKDLSAWYETGSGTFLAQTKYRSLIATLISRQAADQAVDA